MSKRDELIENIKVQLDHLNQHLDELETKAQEVSGEAREKYVKRNEQAARTGPASS